MSGQDFIPFGQAKEGEIPLLALNPQMPRRGVDQSTQLICPSAPVRPCAGVCPGRGW